MQRPVSVWVCLMLASAVALCVSIYGQAQAASDRLTIPQIKIRKPATVQALVSVVDERGNPVKGLGAANFVVRLNDRDVRDFTVQPVEEGERRISVVLAIDVSRSMHPEKIKAARYAAAQFVESLGPQDYSCLLVFGHSVRWLVEEFTTDKQKLKAELANIQANDSATLLNEAFFRAAQKGGTAPTSQVAVVVLTDGHDQTSSIKLDQAIREAQQRNVPVYALGFGSQIDKTSLEQITALTGGRFFPAPDAETLTDFYLMLLKQLSSQYALEFQDPGLKIGEHDFSIELRYRGSSISHRRIFQVESLPPSPGQQAVPPSGSNRLWTVLLVTGTLLLVCGGVLFVFIRKRRSKAVAQERDIKTSLLCAYCGAPLSAGESLYCAKCGGRDSALPTERTIEPITEGAEQP
ncbi:MAG: VWA domain-containing protein, partial [Blastocatellia bacterium]|nr:VWA domain-containing protein [Blastocatellia bacterium]